MSGIFEDMTDVALGETMQQSMIGLEEYLNLV